MMSLEAKSNEQKVLVLTHQNQRLAVQLEEKRKTSKALEDKVAALEQKQEEYEQTLLCVNRVWTQLTTSISHLCGSLAGHADLKPPASASAPPALRDPFLQRLVCDAGPAQAKPLLDAQKRIDAELTDVEAALQDRARSTKEALASVLDAVRSIHARQDELSSQLARTAGASGSGAADAAAAQLRSENGRLAAEAAALRRELDGARAAAASAGEELRLAEDRRTEAEARIRSLQNELADTEQELSNVHKKWLSLKNAAAAAAGAASGGAGAGGGAAGTAAAAGGGSGGAAAADAGGGAAGAGPSRSSSLAGALGESDLADEVMELRAVLTKRTGELEKEREAHQKTKRDLQEAQARLGDEAWVPSSRTYAAMQAQLAALGEAVAARAAEAEAARRERDEALGAAATRGSIAASEAALRSKLAALERSHRELQFARAEADRGRQEAEAALARERAARGGGAKTVSELQGLVGALQAQIANLQQRAALDKVAHERLDAGGREVAAAEARVAAREAEVQRLKDSLARRECEAEEARRREVTLKEALADLKAFVDVLTTYCADPRDVVEVRASEAALRQQLAEARQQLQGHPLQAALREAQAGEREARCQLELARLEADELRGQVSAAQRQAAETSSQLAASRSECELYTKEIETMASAYEELMSQNSRLLGSLAERDEAGQAAAAERIKLAQQIPLLNEAAEAAKAEAERLSRELGDACAVREALERDLTRVVAELGAAREHLRSQASRLDSALLEARRREEALGAAGLQLEGLSKQIEAKAKQLEDADQKNVKEKSRRQRAEEEIKSLQGRVERLKKLQSPAGADRELQAEADAMRQLLNCNVCHERQKNRIITKCCHVFCDVCIDRTLTARNRKCPGCGIVFAKGDIKTFFFT